LETGGASVAVGFFEGFLAAFFATVVVSVVVTFVLADFFDFLGAFFAAVVFFPLFLAFFAGILPRYFAAFFLERAGEAARTFFAFRFLTVFFLGVATTNFLKAQTKNVRIVT
jgi:Na+/H+-translocating membrane pyrophosphatase